MHNDSNVRGFASRVTPYFPERFSEAKGNKFDEFACWVGHSLCCPFA